MDLAAPGREGRLANKDLRNWIEELEAVGELHTIKGAEPAEDIGGIVDIVQRKMGNPALMFDDIPGFPGGSRVMSNLLTSTPRINLRWGCRPTVPIWISSAGGGNI